MAEDTTEEKAIKLLKDSQLPHAQISAEKLTWDLLQSLQNKAEGSIGYVSNQLNMQLRDRPSDRHLNEGEANEKVEAALQSLQAIDQGTWPDLPARISHMRRHILEAAQCIGKTSQCWIQRNPDDRPLQPTLKDALHSLSRMEDVLMMTRKPVTATDLDRHKRGQLDWAAQQLDEILQQNPEDADLKRARHALGHLDDYTETKEEQHYNRRRRLAEAARLLWCKGCAWKVFYEVYKALNDCDMLELDYIIGRT